MSKIITLTRIKDRELYRHCNSIEEMLSALEEEIIELEDLQEKGVEVKPVDTGLLILTVDVEKNTTQYIDFRSNDFHEVQTDKEAF
mgnify:FL=1|jgi:hypothetical protein|tara:strand:+ start:375 stop:632 length:258 start_codon:yes stop_codon:yes gene_type:complete